LNAFLNAFLRRCAAGFIVVAWTIAPAAAQDDLSFAGKTVTMTVGFEAGSGPDLYGRLLGRHLTRYLPGQPGFVVLNQTGAGGVVAMNNWANKSEPNGLSVTIGAQSQTDPDALMRTQAKYDPTTFGYVGGLAAPSQGLFVSKSAVARLHDKSAKPVIMGIVGTTLRTGSYQAVWGAAFLGWNVKWVRGYTTTAELRQAMERGEIDMTSFGATTDLEYLLGTGKFTVVSQSGMVEGGKTVQRPILGDTPLISDLVRGKIKDPMAQKAFDYGEYVSQLGFWFALSPRTPDAIIAAYERAFEATLKDARYQSEFAKIDAGAPVTTRRELEALMRELAKVSPETLDFIQGVLKRQGFG
jgi:tripartite-type tricarboxylate transporter receptor subunit TctC